MKWHLLGLWQFVSAILSQFYLVFGGGLLPPFYQGLSVYVPQFPELEAEWLPWYYLVLFLVATFRAWLIEREAKEECQRKLDNPVDYDVFLTSERINYEELKDVQVVTEGDKKYAKDLIAQWDEWERTYPPNVVSDLKQRTTIPSREEAVAHLKKLDEYNRKLDEFESKIQNCFLLHSFIKNTGHIFDEKILVRVCSASDEEGNKFRLFKNIEEICPIPERPVIGHPRIFDDSAQHEKDIVWDIRDELPDHSIWTRHNIFPGSISVDLAELSAGAGIGLTYGSPVLQSSADEVKLKYWVTSKQTKMPVEKELVLDLKHAVLRFKCEKAKTTPCPGTPSENPRTVVIAA